MTFKFSRLNEIEGGQSLNWNLDNAGHRNGILNNHFPCFYRVIETQRKVCEKREIDWEHEHEG